MELLINKITCLESVCRVIPYRGFESRLLRQKHYKKRLSGRFLLCPIKLSIGTGKCYRFKGQVK
jgi:hypothetical protein